MQKLPKLEYGRYYHIYNRGINRENIFIHQNPQKHRFTDDFRTYPYSSHRAFLSSQPSRIKRRQVLDWFDGLDIFRRQHQTEPDEQQIWHLIEDDFV